MTYAKAAVFQGPHRPFDIRSYPVGTPPRGMASLDLIASGVCGTDIHIQEGRLATGYPSIIGHEFVGRVREIHPEDAEACGIRAGDAAIVDIACPCGDCPLCLGGDDANCLHMGVTNAGDPGQAPHLWGGYAEVTYAPIQNLIKIPEGLDPKTVSVYACAGPTAIHAFELGRQANCGIETARVAVVQGLGPVGTFAVAYLAALGIPHVMAITAGHNPQREALARKLGASQIYSLEKQSIETITQEIAAQNDGMGADLVFEASGSRTAVPQGLGLLRNRGTYLIPGQYSNSGGVEIEPQLITFRALRLIGSSQYSLRDVGLYLQFLQSHAHLRPVIDALITAYPVEKVNEAFADMKAGNNIKTVLVP